MSRTLARLGLAMICLVLTAVGPPSAAIFNGTHADPETNPAMALVVQPDSGAACGGTLVSPTQVVTAAHCVTGESGVPVSDLVVVLEETDLDDVDADEMHAVSAVEVHPDYPAAPSGHFDVAVLTLAASVTTPTARVVRASEHELWAPGTIGTITGWGKTHNAGPTVANLRVGEVPILEDLACPFAGPPGTVFCAGDSGGVDTQACEGDSGGPLLVRDGLGRPVLVGVIVIGDGDCEGTFFPDGYARIGAEPLNSWLHSQLDVPDQVAPRVERASPTGKGVSRAATVKVSFSEPVDPATVTAASLILQRLTPRGPRKVRGNVLTLTADGLTARLDPLGPGSDKLARSTRYRARVTTRVQDLAGNRLDQDEEAEGLQHESWTFRTAR